MKNMFAVIHTINTCVLEKNNNLDTHVHVSQIVTELHVIKYDKQNDTA